MGKDYSNMTTSQIMEDITASFDRITEDWEKLKVNQNAAASRRIRKSLDEISRMKISLRKVMLAEERS